MANYSFEDLLSPIDFEHLVRDLLTKDLDVPLSAFAEGADGGADLRYSSLNEHEIVVQCKRSKYISRDLLEKEVVKIRELKPKHYYFVVSSNLSVKKTDLIKELFGEWMSGDENIYDKSKLNQKLDDYPDVLRKNHKLWFNSTHIFNLLINQPLYERSKALINNIKRDYKYYVKNESLNRSLDILNTHNFIIISGIPGIGKTTLAKLLLMEYLSNGYEVIQIRNIEEGEKILQEETDDKQAFYFDDFLGENFLKYDVIEGRSNDLVEFIQRIMANKSKVMIMTTREYILKQAKERYEKLDSLKFNLFKYTLDLSSYSKRIRSMILYNHLYYGGVKEGYISNLLKNKFYKKIIGHKNYSPRIIEHMTLHMPEVSPEDYPKVFLTNLNEPLKIWDKAFNGQISEGAKYALYILLSIGKRIHLSELEIALDQFHQEIAVPERLDFNRADYKKYLQELEGTFVGINITDKKNHFVDFQNPSIKDFLLKSITDNKSIIMYLLKASVYFEQLIYTVNYIAIEKYKNKEISDLIEQIIINKLETLQENKYTLSSGKEITLTTPLMERIYKLKDYLLKSNKGSLRDFILEKFKSIELTSASRRFKEYVEFNILFVDEIGMDYEHIFKSLIKEMLYLYDTKALVIMNEYDSEKFEQVSKKHQSTINENIRAVVDREIQGAQSKYSLQEIKDEVGEVMLMFDKSTTEILEEFESIVDKKMLEIDDNEEKSTISPVEVHDDEDVFNEDAFFKLEMFG